MIFKLFQSSDSHVTTSETEIKWFQWLKELWVISATLDMLANIR